MKIVKATMQEKLTYRENDPHNPNVLHGWVMVDQHRCAVEYLGEGKGEPNWEVLAPNGYHFDEGVHSLLGTTQQDMLNRIGSLVRCGEECGLEERL